MIIERNTFHLKFGKAKEAIAIWKEVLEAAKKGPEKMEMRLLTDLSGPSYTLIMEIHIRSFNDLNPLQAIWATHPAFQQLYEKFKPLCESAHREFYKIEAMI